MRTIFTILFAVVFVSTLCAQTVYKTVSDISYVSASESDPYRQERCKLDVYYPKNGKDFPTIVWYHGGGLEFGEKHIPTELTDRGFAVVAVNYRLSPHASHPAYIVDAAEALAWTFKNIASYGGSTEKIYVSGHSAGGYLALIIGLDKSYLDTYGVDVDKVAAYLPISGQTLTHYTIRKERGIRGGIPVIDEYAPCFQARVDTPPFILITGGRNLELTSRYEENALLESVLKGIGNNKVELYEFQGFDHGTVLAPGCLWMVDYIQKREK